MKPFSEGEPGSLGPDMSLCNWVLSSTPADANEKNMVILIPLCG